MQLPSINIGEYLHLSEVDKEAYDFAIRYSLQSESRDVLEFGDLTDKTFGEVKDWQQRFTEPDIIVKFILEYYPKTIELDVFSFFAFFRYVESEVKRVSEIESKLLHHEPTAEEEAAGLERFAKLGVGIQIDSLAKGMVWKYEAVRQLPYKECLFKMVLDKTNNDFQNDLQKIILKKHNG